MLKRFSILLMLFVASMAQAQTEILLPRAIAPIVDGASLPMQGTLPTGASPVDINAAGLFAMPRNAEASLTLPGRTPIAVVHDRVETHPSGNQTWIGYLRDFGNSYRVIITTGTDASSGRIALPGGEYSLTSVAGQTWLLDPKVSGLKAAVSQIDDGIVPSEQALKIVQAQSAAAQAADVGEALPSPQSTVDVMVVYTPSLVTQLGSGLQARLDQLIAISNQAYIDSEVAITLRLVHSAQVAYSDITDNSQALYDLTGSNGSVPDNLANVATWRNTYGADLVVLMRAFNYPTHTSCGMAWLNGAGAETLVGSDDFGYAVVSNGVSGFYYCDDLTFVHELGHNMGNMHDHRTDSTATTGVFSYSFGHGIDNSFVTVMAYPSSYTSSPRVGKFSNPSLLSCNGLPCGVTNYADNALSMNNIRTQVAAFRASMKTAQTIDPLTFSPSTLVIGGTSTVSATASSGLAVSFSSLTPNICSVSGGTVAGVLVGTCTIAANQDGDLLYAPAPQFTQNITVGQGSQTISTISFSPNTLRVGGFTTASATASSGYPVTFTSSTPAICAASGTHGQTITGVSVGTCTIEANQDGIQDGLQNYAAASPVSSSIASSGTLEFNPTSLTFDPQSIGSTSTAKSVTLLNTSDTVVGNLGIASTLSIFTVVTNTCGSTLAVGASCTFGVTFTPTALGIQTGAIRATSNAATSPDNLTPVTGQGTAPTAPTCSLTATPSRVSPGRSSTLTATCSGSPTSYTWTGGTCAGTTTSTCTVSPGTTTVYGVRATNAQGSSSPVSATVTVRDVDLTPILMLLLD